MKNKNLMACRTQTLDMFGTRTTTSCPTAFQAPIRNGHTGRLVENDHIAPRHSSLSSDRATNIFSSRLRGRQESIHGIHAASLEFFCPSILHTSFNESTTQHGHPTDKKKRKKRGKRILPYPLPTTNERLRRVHGLSSTTVQ